MVRRKNAELADLAETAANEAERLLANAKRAIRTARLTPPTRRPGLDRTRPPGGGAAGWSAR